MRGDLFVDGRNVLGGWASADAGFVYESFGGSVGSAVASGRCRRWTMPPAATVASVEATPETVPGVTPVVEAQLAAPGGDGQVGRGRRATGRARQRRAVQPAVPLR